jgi:hypothetical protein
VLERFRSAYEKHPVAMQHAHNQGKKRSHTLEKAEEPLEGGEAAAPA